MATEIDIAVTTTTYNVSITADPNEYIVNITTNGGSGIESVTGTTVDNTDPLNPIVEVPNLTQVLETGNTTVDIGILLTNPPGDFASLNHNQLNVTDGDYTGSLKKNVLQFFNIATGLTTNFLPTGLSLIKSGSESTEVSFETPTALNNILIPNQSGTIAMLSDIPTIPTAAIDRGTFSGEFALSNAVRGGEYTPLTQTGALTLSIGASSVNGGIDTVLLTANGSAISGFSTWKKLSSDSISTTAATVMFIMVRQYQGVIYYTVNIIT